MFKLLAFAFKVLQSLFNLLKRRLKSDLITLLKYINNDTYLGGILLDKCLMKTFLKAEGVKLKFEIFYLSKVKFWRMRELKYLIFNQYLTWEASLTILFLSTKKKKIKGKCFTQLQERLKDKAGNHKLVSLTPVLGKTMEASLPGKQFCVYKEESNQEQSA